MLTVIKMAQDEDEEKDSAAMPLLGKLSISGGYWVGEPSKWRPVNH